MPDLFQDSASLRARIGVVTHGSLGDGVEMKLDPARPVESVRAGTFVVVEFALLWIIWRYRHRPATCCRARFTATRGSK